MDPKSEVYSREEYATKEFWDNRYKEKGSYFDWYAEFPELKETFENQYGMNSSHSVLMLGCGNSKLSEQMYEAGYHDILNVDISQTVIEQMKSISEEKGQTKMRWEVMDATDMNTVADKSYDCAIDKGTLDALISGKNLDICQKMIKQTMRILKDDGQFILITHGSPEGRKKIFQNSIGFDDFDYYVTKVDLNTMSTLINLMRSNLEGKPLNQIMKDKEAMAKSVLEFNLIQMLRKKKKSQKQFVIWKQFAKKKIANNENQQIGKQQAIEQLPKQQKVQEKQATKEEVKATEEQKQPQNVQSKNEEEKTSKTIYNPKKQSFCYVYSVKRKFAYDMKEIISQRNNLPILLEGIANISDQKIDVVGETPEKISMFLYDDLQLEAAKAIFYLKEKKIPMNSITIHRKKEYLTLSKERMKVSIKQGKQSAFPLFNKSVMEVEVDYENQLGPVEKKFEKAVDVITEKLNCHPDPRQYAYMGILMNKIGCRSYYYKFLKKYWYPTWKLNFASGKKANYSLTLPPNVNTKEAETLLKDIFGSNCETKTKVKGFINFIEPRMMSIINMGSLVYKDGNQIPMIVQSMPEGSELNEIDYSNPVVVLDRKNIAKILAYLLSSL